MRYLFLLTMDFRRHGPSVHLLNDVINSLATSSPESEIVIFSKKTGEEGKTPSCLANKNVSMTEIVAEAEKSSFFKRYLCEIKYARQCAKAYKGQHFDVVFLQSCNTAFFHLRLLKKHTKAKVLYNVQDIFPHNLRFMGKLPLAKLSFPILAGLQRKAYKKCDAVVTISKDMRDLIAGDMKKAEDKLYVIHNWGYEDRATEIAREENPFYTEGIFSADTFNVLYAGNMGVVQNIELIVRAATLLKDRSDVHFYFIGDGARKNAIVQSVKEAALENVTFLPMQDEKKAPYLYAAADANLIPLAPGIIRTALPSKTPACLASGRHLIACIEKESELGQLLSKTEGCYVASNQGADELASLICAMASEKNKFYSDRGAALSVFSSEKNPRAYADLLMALSQKQ